MRTTFVEMEHLATEAVVAFVDGELGMTAYQRAAAHLSVCAECAADLDAQQCARTAVRTAAPLVMPAALLGMLCRIPETSAPAPQQLPAPAPSPAPAVSPAPATINAAPRSRRSLPLGVFAVSALAVGLLTVAVGVAPPGTNDQLAKVNPVPAQRGAQVVAASSGAHAQLVSFGVMFDGAGAAPQTRTSP